MKSKNVAIFVIFSLMFSLIAFGYAALTDTMGVRGTAEVNTPEGLFVTAITRKSQSGLDVYTSTFAEYSTAVTTNLSKSSDRTAGSVTYVIRVFNNTKHE